MTTQHVMATLAALAFIGGPALAKPVQNDGDAPRMAAVSYADLNLNTETGKAILVARIHLAAQTVCGPAPDSRDLKGLPPYQQCMKQSVDAAVAAIPAASQLAGSTKPAG